MTPAIVMRRFSSKCIKTWFQWFPKTIPNGKPCWEINMKSLKKEFRSLQSIYHPDITNDQRISTDLNKAYQTLLNPLSRSLYYLQLEGIDLEKDDIAQNIMQQDPQLLMKVLDVHEQLEEIENEDDLEIINNENKGRIKDVESSLKESFANQEWNRCAQLTIELKYWINLNNAIKEWKPGMSVKLTH